MIYRKEIDGLRALAVLPVILYHAGIAPFNGGFIGVDIFFVISGYLITTIIINERIAGTFSLLNFYERRARRILPALFFVLLICLPLAWCWLLPEDMKSFSQSLVAVSAFSSNILFYLTTGYFLPAAEYKPLLHTWSLAVEEQYYILFPVLISLMWKFGLRRIFYTLVVLACLSLSLAEFASANSANFNFFLLPTRAWELLIGALVAFFLSNNPSFHLKDHPQQVNELLSGLGFMGILFTIFQYNNNIPFPSLYTLVPTLGAALIILYGTDKTMVGKLLGAAPLVGIGLISYSAYLWHQPLFAFAKQISIHEPSKALLLILSLASLALGFLTWRFIEKPFRNKTLFTRRQIFKLAIIGSVFFITVGIIGHVSNGFDWRLDEQQKKIAAYSKYNLSHQYTCFLEPDFTSSDYANSCQGGVKEGGVLIWGDSYAAALSVGLHKTNPHMMQYTAASCPPIMHADLGPRCTELNTFVMQKIVDKKPSTIYLHANWHTYQATDLLNNTLKEIARLAPNSHVVIIGSVPQWRPTLPIYLNKVGIKLDGTHFLEMTHYQALFTMDKHLMQVADKQNAVFISLMDKLCKANMCMATLPAADGFTMSAWDNGHLTEEGALFVAKQMPKH